MSKFKRGDTVYSFKLGWSTIETLYDDLDMDDDDEYAVLIRAKTGMKETMCYTLEGKCETEDDRPTLLTVDEAKAWGIKPPGEKKDEKRLSSAYKRHHIDVDIGRPLTFEGKLIGSASMYQHGDEEWSESYLYITKSGKYVCNTIRRIAQNEIVQSRAAVCDDVEHVFKIMGWKQLARRLYESAGLNPFEEV